MKARFELAALSEGADIRSLAEHFGAKFGRVSGTTQSLCILPGHNERTPSFTVYPDSNSFYCFGCSRGGDPLRLVQEVHGWTGRAEFRRALEWLADFTGVKADLTEGERKAAQDAYRAKRKAHEDHLAKVRREKEEKAFSIWSSCEPFALDLKHPAERYLRDRRGIDLDRLPRLPRATRVGWRRLNVAPDGELDQWVEAPVIANLMARGKANTACHVTFLLPDGSDTDRRVGAKGRLVYGSPNGAAIKVHRGASLLSDADAYERHGKADTLALTEGFEDALSLALLWPQWRIWAAYSLGNIGRVEAPNCAGEIVICAENDVSAAARDALARAQSSQLRLAKGRDVSIAYPPEGCKDWNAVHERVVQP